MHETDEYVIIQITITRVITGYLRQFIKLKPPYNLPGLFLKRIINRTYCYCDRCLSKVIECF